MADESKKSDSSGGSPSGFPLTTPNRLGDFRIIREVGRDGVEVLHAALELPLHEGTHLLDEVRAMGKGRHHLARAELEDRDQPRVGLAEGRRQRSLFVDERAAIGAEVHAATEEAPVGGGP